jgi:NADH dehydrogenase FAD-containing subunit
MAVPRFGKRNLGAMAAVGRSEGIAQIGPGVHPFGFLDWLAWLLPHIADPRNERSLFSSW